MMSLPNPNKSYHSHSSKITLQINKLFKRAVLKHESTLKKVNKAPITKNNIYHAETYRKPIVQMFTHFGNISDLNLVFNIHNFYNSVYVNIIFKQQILNLEQELDANQLRQLYVEQIRHEIFVVAKTMKIQIHAITLLTKKSYYNVLFGSQKMLEIKYANVFPGVEKKFLKALQFHFENLSEQNIGSSGKSGDSGTNSSHSSQKFYANFFYGHQDYIQRFNHKYNLGECSTYKMDVGKLLKMGELRYVDQAKIDSLKKYWQSKLTKTPDKTEIKTETSRTTAPSIDLSKFLARSKFDFKKFRNDSYLDMEKVKKDVLAKSKSKPTLADMREKPKEVLYPHDKLKYQSAIEKVYAMDKLLGWGRRKG